MYYKFKSTVAITGVDFHNYNTRQRHYHRQSSHRLELAASLPQNIGPKLFNKLPENLKLENTQSKFKILLTNYLLNRTCYSITEFLN